jgi:PDZ domain-containing protein
MSPRLARQLLAGAMLVGLVVVGALLPVPFVAMSPGPVYDTLGEQGGQPLISISGTTTYPTDGRLDLTTVSENGGPGRRITLVETLVGWARPAVAVLPEALLYPPDATADEVQQQNAADMSASQDAATVAALRLADVPLTTTAVVSSVDPDGPSAGILEPDDVVVAVDGTAVSNPEDVRRLVSAHKPGESVRLTIERDGKQQDVTITTEAADGEPDHAIIGVVPRLGYSSDVTVDIQLENVGGPSAGLMFALGIYDKLTPGPLTGGRHIAGTGTMAVDGTVGAIGGVQQKLVAARRAGATVFFVPKDNCAEAVPAAPDGLRLVRADSLREASEALEDLDDQGDAAVLPTCPATPG